LRKSPFALTKLCEVDWGRERAGLRLLLYASVLRFRLNSQLAQVVKTARRGVWLEFLDIRAADIPGARHGYIVFKVNFLSIELATFFFEGQEGPGHVLTAAGIGDNHLDADNPQKDRFDGDAKGLQVCSWIGFLRAAAERVKSAHIHYKWLGPNSSSVLRYMLERLPDHSWFHKPRMVGYNSKLPGIET
jgi:hypothetical protein